MRWSKAWFVASLLVALIVFSQPRHGEPVSSIERRKAGVGLSTLAEEWLSAVAGNDSRTALALAKELISEPARPVPADYIDLLEAQGIKGCFLTAPFDHWDFQLWRDAYFFHKLSQEVFRGDEGNIEAIFAVVREHVAPHEGMRSDSVLPWPYGVWSRGYGVCDRQAWVFSELAYQAGWETQIVYLMDPMLRDFPHGNVVHAICELRNKDGAVWFADPLEGFLFPRSVADVGDDHEILKTLWPDQPAWRRGLQEYVLCTPSYPQDYRPHNLELYEALKKTLASRCPRFGIPPTERLAEYRKLTEKNTSVGTVDHQRPSRMQFWVYPIDILKEDIKRYADQGRQFFLKGHYDEAVSHYVEALHLKPESAIVHFDLGDALAKQGRIKEAIAEYQEALNIQPDFTNAKRHLKSLTQDARNQRL